MPVADSLPASGTTDAPVVGELLPPAGAEARDPIRRYEPMISDVQVFDEHGESVDAVMLPPPVDGLTDTQQGYLDRSTEVPSGRSYRLQTDTARDGFTRTNELIERVPPVTNWHIIYAHGKDGRIQVANEHGGYDDLTPEEFAPLLRHDPTRDGIDQIGLVVCEANREFAPKLYQELGGEFTIMACDDLLVLDAHGTIAAQKVEGYDPATGNPMLGPPGPAEWTMHEKRGTGPAPDASHTPHT